MNTEGGPPLARLKKEGNSLFLMYAISPVGLAKLPANQFEINNEANDAQGILVRSADLHDVALPKSLLAIARAGAGTNNIPIDQCTEQGIVVFNTPGANANAVASRLLGRATSCRSALRTRKPCASLASLLISNWLAGSFASPTGEMAFMVLMVYIMADNPL